MTEQKEIAAPPSQKDSARPREQDELCWPYLVYRELLAMVVASILLWTISLAWDAPLEELANATLTPNPAKAPWYFLGLQELLVYFDPWIAGVLLPGLIIVGLMVIPYVDPNREGTGQYALGRRKVAVSIFLFGLVLWFVLIFIGTSCRGQNWAWYWPWEDFSVAKPALAHSFSLSPALGWAVCLAYFGGGLLLPRLCFRDLWIRLGWARSVCLMGLLLWMAAVPLKIVLRLAFDLKYVLVTPWFNL